MKLKKMMIKRICIIIFVFCSYIFVIGDVNSQTETILKHRILKKEGRERQNYIKEKYKYNNLQLQYQINLSYNGWQIYDSNAYEYKNGEAYKYWYLADYIDTCRCPKFSFRGIDTITNDFTDNKLVHEIVYDKYNLLWYYIKDAVRALECGGDYMEYTCSNNFPTITDSSYSISSLSCSNSLLFMEYGNVVTSVLNKFSYQINSLNQYESDEFVFDNNIVVKRRFYYKHSGDIDNVECLLYVNDILFNEWIEWYEYFNE